MPNQSTQTSQSASRGRMPNARPNNASQAAQGQATSGQAVENHLYGIVSVLYHALQGEQTYEQYARDARQAGDSELEEFFNLCRTDEHARAEQAKSLLADRLEVEEDDDEAESAGEDDEEGEDEDEDEE